MPGSSAKTRIASKQQECCTICNMSKGENWILCERSQTWTHNTCMGYSKDEFKFLERANMTFTCSSCLQSPPIDAIDTKELSRDITELKESVESTRTMVEEVLSCRQPLQTVAKYSDVVKTKIDYDHELSFKGIPEFKDAEKESTERVDRSKVFEPDEKLIQSAFENLRLRKIELEKTQPRRILVKFRDVFTVEKLLARAPNLKMYEPEYMGNKNSIFILKSLNKEEQAKEQSFSKKMQRAT